MTYRFGSILAAACSILLAAPSLAAAEETPATAEDTGLTDIVVTARRAMESLMRVPVSESVVSAETLTRYNIADLTSIGFRVPSVSFDRTSGASASGLVIRGIGSADSDSAIEQSVSVVIDGMQISKGFVVQQATFDLSQVEFLKGPQALFFGKNVSAGVVALHSANPTDRFEAYLRGGYEFNAREKTLEGAVSGPLSDTLGARLAFRGSHMRGWMKNDARPLANPFFPATPLPGSDDRYIGNKDIYGRLTLVFEPSTDFKATLKTYGGTQRDKGWGSTNETGNCSNPPLASYVSGGIRFVDPYSDCKLDGHTSACGLPPSQAAPNPGLRDGQPYGEYTSSVTSLTLDYDAGPLTLTSITGYHWYHQKVSVGNTNSIFPYAGFIHADYTFDQFSQELRAVTKLDGPLNFTFGGYFGTDKLDHEQQLFIAALPADPITGMFDTVNRIGRPSGKSYSVFAQARWNVTPEIELAGGARYSRDRKKGLLTNTFINATFAALRPGFLAPVGTVFRDAATFHNVSPEATITWRPHSDLMLYGAYKTGYKSGGFAAQSIVTPNAAPPGSIPGTTTFGFKYEPEKVRGGEIGFKAQLAGRSLRLTGTAYHYDYTSLQLSNFSAAPVPTLSILNAGKLRTKGLETELLWKASDELNIHGTLAYTHARYVEFSGIDCYNGQTAAAGCLTYTSGPKSGSRYQDLSGRPAAKAPDWTFSVGYAYDRPLSDSLVLGLSSDLRYSGKYYLQQNQSPFGIQDAYAVLDASVRLGASDESWQLSLIGRNLTNKYYATSSVDKPGGAVGPGGEDMSMIVARPRQVQLVLAVKY